jgi:hypothetical protein
MIYDLGSFGVILVQYIYIWYSSEHSSSILLLVLSLHRTRLLSDIEHSREEEVSTALGVIPN